MSQTCSSEDVKGKPHISCTEVPQNIVDAYPETPDFMILTHTQCYILHSDLESGNKHELNSILVCFTYSNSCKQGW